MSGPQARMGSQKMIAIKLSKTGRKILCEHCEPVPGWGWETDRMERQWRRLGLLPPQGNGFNVTGTCSYCLGTGFCPIPFTELIADE